MLLAIDCGNTNIVFAVYDGDTLRGQWRAATKAERTADEYGIWLTQLLSHEGIDPKTVDAAIVASVVPGKNFDLTKLCEKYFGCAPRFIGQPGLKLGSEALVDNPRQLGADRIVNAVAAYATYKSPLIIIDFGTATTFDVVDSDGNYRGGCIAPGINLSLEALHMATAQLPRLHIENPGNAPVIGTNTRAQIISGVFWGYIGLIEGLVARMKAERAEKMTVIATGGLAPLLATATPAIEHIDQDLTLRGLLLIHKRNA
jgi:type III pantothenate kinase